MYHVIQVVVNTLLFYFSSLHTRPGFVIFIHTIKQQNVALFQKQCEFTTFG